MKYTYSDYALLYGANSEVEKSFNRILWDAEKIVNDLTTGVDGICKLRVAFPNDEYSKEAVKRAILAVVDKIAKVEEMNRKIASGGVVKSMSAGNESVSYETGSEIASVAASDSEQRMYYSRIAEHYLSGVGDSNGVNLLYRGMYPYRV
ncbi:MAG: hypothetical protein KBT34_09885 [Prevotella sp.]|nr:hypothetical protein [Candidatus Prevotella equi]